MRKESQSSIRTDDEGGGEFDRSGNFVVGFNESEIEIAVVSGDNQSDAMIDAVNFLIEHDDLISKLEPLPWIPGRTKAIVNDAEEWEKADPQYRELTDGNFLDVKLNKDRKKQEIRRMAGKCGVEARFEGDW